MNPLSKHAFASANRLIVHVDMDAFFASVEQLDHPELRGKAVIVGGSLRGVVCACSYEARKYGVHSAMPIIQAKRMCPHGMFVPVRMARYAQVSRQVMSVLQGFSPLVEQASVDEAFLDGSGLERIFGPPPHLGMTLKHAIYRQTGLTCSVGMAPVKFLAKIASDQNKPDGLFILTPEHVSDFLKVLPVSKIPGVGRHGLEKLTLLGVRTAGDITRYPESFWAERFGKWGSLLHARAQGVDNRFVTPDAPTKSEGAENTFAEDCHDREELKRWLLDQAERVSCRLRRYGHKGRTVTLKIKFSDFKMITRGITLREPTASTRVIFESAAGLLDVVNLPQKVRLIGLTVSNFSVTQRQLPLFSASKTVSDEILDAAMDSIREKYGLKALVRGRVFDFRRES